MKVERSKSTGPGGADSSAGKLGGTVSSATASPDAVKPVSATAPSTPLTKPASESQQNSGQATSDGKSSEMQLKALVQDLHEVFKELGIVPPPSRFGGIQLALAAEENAADASQKGVNSNTQLDLMRLMIVKNMAKTMADRLAEKQKLQPEKDAKEGDKDSSENQH